MPTKRTRRGRHLVEDLTEYQVAYLLDRPLPPATSEDDWWLVVESAGYRCAGSSSAYYERSAEILWRRHRERLLPEYVRDSPGSRPAIWWTVDAPEPRRRLGGTGTSLPDAGFAHRPRWHYGIQCDWHAANPADPPRYEAQAEYVRRHKLFLPGEERRLKAEDYGPEVVLPDLAEVVELGHA